MSAYNLQQSRKAALVALVESRPTTRRGLSQGGWVLSSFPNILERHGYAEHVAQH